MAKVLVRLMDPGCTLEEAGVKITGTNEVEVEATDKIKKFIKIGYLLKLSDVAEPTKSVKADEKQKSDKSEKS